MVTTLGRQQAQIVCDLGVGTVHPQLMENQMEKKMENEMETGII